MVNIETVGLTIAVFAGLYVLYVTFRRLRGDSSDPSASLAVQSDTGSFTFLLSGSWFIAALITLVAGLTWPLPVENPVLGFVMVGTVASHWFLERREVM